MAHPPEHAATPTPHQTAAQNEDRIEVEGVEPNEISNEKEVESVMRPLRTSSARAARTTAP